MGERNGEHLFASQRAGASDKLRVYKLARFRDRIVDHLKRHNFELKAHTVIPIETKDFPTKAVRPLNSRLDLARLREVFGL